MTALAVDTGSAKMGTVQFSHRYWMVSAGRLVSMTQMLALLMTSNLEAMYSGVR